MTSRFSPAPLTRIPLEGYRERCRPGRSWARRFAARPIELEIPIMITGMSYGALSYNAKVALAQGASRGGNLDHYRRWRHASRRARNSRRSDLRSAAKPLRSEHPPPAPADAIELTIGQGAKPGTGGLLLGSKVSPEIARMRDLPARRGPAQSLPAPGLARPRRHDPQDRGAARGDRLAGADLREDRGHAGYDDVKLAAKAGADVVVIDGMEGGTGASPEIAHGPHRNPDTRRRRARRGARWKPNGSSAKSS